MHQSIERQVRTASQQLMARYADGGMESVASDIERSLRDDVHSDLEVYLLLDASGRRVAGNIEPLPPPVGETEVIEPRRALQRSGRPVVAHVHWRALPEGAWLVAGQDLSELELLQQLIGNASAAAAMFALLLLAGGTFLFRVELERSVAALRRTAARIAAGQLQERVALEGDEDEFGLLKHDINQMLDRIQQLMDGVRNVSDSIAHNVRTPLTRVILRLHVAQDEKLPAAARQAEIAAAMQDLQDLTRTFEKLLQIAEAESGSQRRRFRSVALHEIADDVVELYQPVAESRGSRLLREPGGEARVQGDRDLLADALSNLVDNAIKYAGDGATIRVGTAADARSVLLTVQDDGPGVPAGEYERMGSRFYRLDRSRPGYGLGLASVRAMAILHGGALRFENAAPGLRVQMALPPSPSGPVLPAD
jgi:signal transduction histidine kinase